MQTAAISTKFYDNWYVPFSPGNLILDELVEPMTLETMQELVGADCWGLYVRGADGGVKEALYNVAGLKPHTPEYDAQQPFRNIAMDRVGPGETLVLHMFWDHDGWSVEATRGEDGAITFALKHGTGYERACYRAGCDDRGTYEYVIQGAEDTEIKLVDQEFITVRGAIEPLSWTTHPDQMLGIYNEDGSLVMLRAEPINGVGPDVGDDDSYTYYARKYDSPESEPVMPRTEIKMTCQEWRKLLRWLAVHARRIPVE